MSQKIINPERLAALLYILLTVGNATESGEKCPGYFTHGECLNRTCLDGFVEREQQCWPTFRYIFTIQLKEEQRRAIVADEINKYMKLKPDDMKTIDDVTLEFYGKSDLLLNIYKLFDYFYILAGPGLARLQATHKSVPQLYPWSACISRYAPLSVGNEMKKFTRNIFMTKLDLAVFKRGRFYDIGSNIEGEQIWYNETWCAFRASCVSVKIPWQERGGFQGQDDDLVHGVDKSIDCRVTINGTTTKMKQTREELTTKRTTTVSLVSDKSTVKTGIMTSIASKRQSGTIGHSSITVRPLDGETTNNGKTGNGDSVKWLPLSVVIVLSLF